jgi:hypothetical protein
MNRIRGVRFEVIRAGAKGKPGQAPTSRASTDQNGLI